MQIVSIMVSAVDALTGIVSGVHPTILFAGLTLVLLVAARVLRRRASGEDMVARQLREAEARRGGGRHE